MRRIALPSAPLLAPLLAWAALGVTSPAHAAGLDDLYYERTLMRQAGARCNLFAPKLALALEAATLQVRGAALRKGESPAQLQAVEARARARAYAEPCASPALHIAAQRVRAAFMSWSRQNLLVLPGRRAAWTARRWPDHRERAWWSLSAPGSVGGRALTIGLRREDGPTGPLRFTLDAALPDAGRAYAVRLIMRDPARAPQPYLAADDSPPPGASLSVLAGTKAPDGAGGWRFTFPDAAAEALARLDPRESARLELAFAAPREDRVVSTLVEAGDFAAGRAFLLAGG